MSFEKPGKLVQASENKRKEMSAKEIAERDADLGVDKKRKEVKKIKDAAKEAPILEIKRKEKSTGEFGIPKGEKVLEENKELSSADVVSETAIEIDKAKEKEKEKEKENKEKAEVVLRENFVRAQLDFEKVKQAGGYDSEDYKAKLDAANKKLEETKEFYFKNLKGREAGLINKLELENKDDVKLIEKNKLNFTVEEFSKLQDAKINLRAEEGAKKSHFPANIIKDVGNWYRKQSTRDKYIVAAGLIGGGILAGIAGSAILASAVGTTAIVSRILSGAGTAVALETAIAQGRGKKFGMHIGHKGLMEEKTAQEIEKITKGITVESAANFFEKNEEAIATASERLYKESKKLETQRALISGAMGAVISTGLLGDALKNAMHWTGTDKAIKGAFDWTREHLGLGGHESAVVPASVKAHESVSVKSEDINKLATVRKGEGITQVLERQLEHDPTKFGFSGHDINNAAEVHKWAQHHAYELAVKNGFISEKTGGIVAGTEHVLEKNPLHYGFKGDVNNVNQVHEWAMREAHNVAAKTGTDIPGVSETRVKWDYSQSADKQAAYVLDQNGKVTEVLSSAKNPHYLYDTSEVIKTQKGLDLINEQIKASDANIDKLNIDAAKEARRRLATGMGSYHSEKLLDKELANADVLAAEKARLEYELKFHGGNANAPHHAFEVGHHAGASHAGFKEGGLAGKISHIEAQFNKDNAFLLDKIPSGLKESIINSDKIIDLGRIEPEFDKLDFEHQNKVIHFLNDRVADAHVKNIGESAVLSEKLSEHLSQNHSYLKNMTEFLGKKAGFRFDVELLGKIKNMSIDDLHKSIKTMALTRSPNWGGGITLSNPHLGAYESLNDFIKDHGFKGGKEKISEVLGKIATNLRNK